MMLIGLADMEFSDVKTPEYRLKYHIEQVNLRVWRVNNSLFPIIPPVNNSDSNAIVLENNKYA